MGPVLAASAISGASTLGASAIGSSGGSEYPKAKKWQIGLGAAAAIPDVLMALSNMVGAAQWKQEAGAMTRPENYMGEANVWKSLGTDTGVREFLSAYGASPKMTEGMPEYGRMVQGASKREQRM
jgi:hypothetical protein